MIHQFFEPRTLIVKSILTFWKLNSVYLHLNQQKILFWHFVSAKILQKIRKNISTLFFDFIENHFLSINKKKKFENIHIFIRIVIRKNRIRKFHRHFETLIEIGKKNIENQFFFSNFFFRDVFNFIFCFLVC